MKNLATFLFLFLISNLLGQKKDYYVLEGKIGKHPISLNLMFTAPTEDATAEFIGFYHYHSEDIPISVYQSKFDGLKLELIHGGDEESAEIFMGTFENGIYKGSWSKAQQVLKFELKESNPSNFTEMIHFKASKNVEIKIPNSSDSVNGSYGFDWFVPKDEKLQRELVNLVGSDYVDFKSYSENVFQDFEEMYTEEVNSFLEEIDENDFHPETWNYFYSVNFFPILNNSNYLTMAYSGYQYTGGAHGISYQNNYTYDKRKGKWLKIGDILNLNFEKEIISVLDKRLRKIYRIPDGVGYSQVENSIFINDSISVSSNFSISKKGITFHYGLYEMTPYVYGYFDLFVPYADLKPYLNKNFKY